MQRGWVKSREQMSLYVCDGHTDANIWLVNDNRPSPV